MDRVYFKTRAKQVLQNNFWYLVGIILIVALLSLDLIGASYETIVNALPKFKELAKEFF